MEGKGVLAYTVSSKDIDYKVMSRWEGERKKRERGRDKKRILKSMVTQSEENVLFLSV